MRCLRIGVVGIPFALATLPGFAGSESPPPLTPPAELPSMTVPLPPPASDVEAPPADTLVAPDLDRPRPILAVPGLPDLRPPRPVATPAPGPSGGSTPSGIPLASPALDLPGAGDSVGGIGSPIPDGPPSLVGPAGTADEAPGRIGPPSLVGPADLGGVSPSLSPLPAPRYSPDPPPGMGREGGLSLEPAAAGGRGLQPGRTIEPRSVARPDDRPDTGWSPPAPRRRLFGLVPLPGRPAEADRVPPPAQARTTPTSTSPRELDAASDISPDLALERRIRTQIRSGIGDDIRSLDVRVVDKEVYIRTQASRFWQKRGVKRAIESMPILKGYQARVHVD